MPKVSRDSAPQRQEAGPVVDLRDELDGYTASFTSVLEDMSVLAHSGHFGHVEQPAESSLPRRHKSSAKRRRKASSPR
jgi:hypothetical protein